MKQLYQGIFRGAVGGLIASLCCLGPTVLILLGVGGLLGITSFCYPQYRLPFLVVGLFFISLATFFHFKKFKIVKKCDLQNFSKKKSFLKFIISSLVSMFLLYAGIIYLLLPQLQATLFGGYCSLA